MGLYCEADRFFSVKLFREATVRSFPKEQRNLEHAFDRRSRLSRSSSI
jgi:hypothetical protein